MNKCIACGKELSTNATIIEGVGGVCRSALLLKTEERPSRLCAYEIEFIDEEKIVILHEKTNPKLPTISLTNCIEQVLNKVVKEYGICTGLWAFVEHASYPVSSKGYDEYDLVDLTGKDVDWRYLWHSDAREEKSCFSQALLIERVNRYRKKEEK